MLLLSDVETNMCTRTIIDETTSQWKFGTNASLFFACCGCEFQIAQTSNFLGCAGVNQIQSRIK